MIALPTRNHILLLVANLERNNQPTDMCGDDRPEASSVITACCDCRSAHAAISSGQQPRLEQLLTPAAFRAVQTLTQHNSRAAVAAALIDEGGSVVVRCALHTNTVAGPCNHTLVSRHTHWCMGIAACHHTCSPSPARPVLASTRVTCGFRWLCSHASTSRRAPEVSEVAAGAAAYCTAPDT